MRWDISQVVSTILFRKQAHLLLKYNLFPPDNIFAQNFMKLSQMESDERNIDMYNKDFDFNYKPPQSHPKGNIHTQDNALASKMQPCSTTTPGLSPFLGASALLSNTPTVYDEIDKGLSALHLSNGLPPYSNENSFVHGVIGEKLKSHMG